LSCSRIPLGIRRRAISDARSYDYVVNIDAGLLVNGRISPSHRRGRRTEGGAKGGDVTLYVDGRPVGTGRVGATQPMIFSADETTGQWL
jgi:hypothetical protein